jgi:hypothetical protein
MISRYLFLSIFCHMLLWCMEADECVLYAFQSLFQNDSPTTLLARVMGTIGSIEQAMLAQGRHTYKYFIKNHMLYEKNQVCAF